MLKFSTSTDSSMDHNSICIYSLMDRTSELLKKSPEELEKLNYLDKEIINYVVDLKTRMDEPVPILGMRKTYSMYYIIQRCMDVISDCETALRYHYLHKDNKFNNSEWTVFQAYKRLHRSCLELAEEIYFATVFPDIPDHQNKNWLHRMRLAEQWVWYGRREVTWINEDQHDLMSCRCYLHLALADLNKAQYDTEDTRY